MQFSTKSPHAPVDQIQWRVEWCETPKTWLTFRYVRKWKRINFRKEIETNKIKQWTRESNGIIYVTVKRPEEEVEKQTKEKNLSLFIHTDDTVFVWHVIDTWKSFLLQQIDERGSQPHRWQKSNRSCHRLFNKKKKQRRFFTWIRWTIFIHYLHSNTKCQEQWKHSTCVSNAMWK